MDFNEYQEKSRKTAVYPNLGGNILYPTLGLCGESGEVAEKIKKMIRDDEGILTNDRRGELKKELGDVLWYLSNLCIEVGLSLNDVAITNIEKLNCRRLNNTLHGSGDER